MKLVLNKIFDGKAVTIIGGGPSIEGFDFSVLRQPVIAVNDSFKDCKSKMLVAIDSHWYTQNQAEVTKYNGLIVSTNRNCFERTKLVELDEKNSLLDWCIMRANLSGFLALAVALHLGASKVYLLGFDGGHNGKSNYNRDNAKAKSVNYERINMYYEIFAQHNIVNVGLSSRINYFNKVPLNGNFYRN